MVEHLGTLDTTTGEAHRQPGTTADICNKGSKILIREIVLESKCRLPPKKWYKRRRRRRTKMRERRSGEGGGGGEKKREGKEGKGEERRGERKDRKGRKERREERKKKEKMREGDFSPRGTNEVGQHQCEA